MATNGLPMGKNGSSRKSLRETITLLAAGATIATFLWGVGVALFHLLPPSFVTYKSVEQGFSMEYPSDWSQQSASITSYSSPSTPSAAQPVATPTPSAPCIKGSNGTCIVISGPCGNCASYSYFAHRELLEQGVWFVSPNSRIEVGVFSGQPDPTSDDLNAVLALCIQGVNGTGAGTVTTGTSRYGQIDWQYIATTFALVDTRYEAVLYYTQQTDTHLGGPGGRPVLPSTFYLARLSPTASLSDDSSRYFDHMISSFTFTGVL